MTNKEATQLLEEMWMLLWQEMRKGTFSDIQESGKKTDFIVAHNMAIKALEQEPCDDAISRQAVLDTCLNIFFNGYKEKDLLYDIKKLPSVNPQKPKTGHWIKTIGENGITSAVRCSECGFEDNRYMLFRYCPNCGAKMAESEEV